MSYYIIIRGPLGIGKTTVAKKLARRLKAEYASIDSILEEENLDKIKGKHISLGNFLKADKIILPKVKEKLNKGKIIVFDGNFYLKKQLLHIISSLRMPHYIFTLKAPLEVCIKRDSRRKRKYGQAATKTVYKLVTRFDYGTVIDTKNKTSEEVVKNIISHLSE